MIDMKRLSNFLRSIVVRNQHPEEKLPCWLHFIWAGGQKIMIPESRKAVIKWAKANPSFKVIVWIDLVTTPENALRRYFGDLLSGRDGVVNICLKDITTWLEIRNDEDLTNCIMNMTEVEKHIELAIPLVRYEIDRLDPNYGSSSDLLRYLILFYFGGAYFDSDINPGAQSLEELYRLLRPRIQASEDIFLTAQRSQHNGTFNNDSFICSKGNPVMWAVIECAKRNYHIGRDHQENELSSFNRIVDIHNYSRYTTTERDYISATLHRTGQFPILEVVMKYRMHEACNITQLLPQHQLPENFYQPFMINTCEWTQPQEVMSTAPGKRISIEDIIRIVMQTILFEANELGFMRFDDHVFNIMHGIDARLDDINCTNTMALQLLGPVVN